MTSSDCHRLRSEIDAKGWSLRETERQADLPVATLSPFFSGKTKDLKLETWRKLSAALEVPLAQLLGEAELETHGVRLCSLEQLEPDLNNPRQVFAETELTGLAHSIKRHGILQNLVARPVPTRTDRFQLISGERRYLAIGQLVERDEWDPHEANIPVLVLQQDEAETRVLAILENVQRVQLTPIEEGEAYAELMALDPERWTTAALAETIGKSQRYVQQRVSIGTGLIEEAKEALAAGEITIEQARSMATAPPDEQQQILAAPSPFPPRPIEEPSRRDMSFSIGRKTEADPADQSLGEPQADPPRDDEAPLPMPGGDHAVARTDILKRRLQRHLSERPWLGVRLFLWDLLKGHALHLPLREETECWPISAEYAHDYLQTRGVACNMSASGALDVGPFSGDEAKRTLPVMLAMETPMAQLWLAGALAAKLSSWSDDWTLMICEAVGVPTRAPVVPPTEAGEGREA